ncbi:MAG: LacI family DNA-binding transcriptional regulator [Lachnospiraceae bacterium]|nr:LacI family DNA-binding transcriptional regulator [Lachnospiraceae bacterium]
MAGRVGIRDIARMAGVSAGTVSKVLKNYPGISENTRKKVMEVVEETGFIPNSVASALSSKQKDRIALFIYVNDRSQQIDEINMLYILGAFEQARKENLELITVFNASIEKLSPEETLRYFHSIYVDTVIVFGLNKKDEKIRYLSETGNMKVVVVDACMTGESVSTVMIDHTKGQYEVASRICPEGGSVLYLKGRDDGFVTDMRLNGMMQLSEDKHLQLDVAAGDFSESRAYNIVKGLEKEYDAIVCASDLMAIGAKHALPKGSKTKVSGFDGIRLMEYAANDVITCRQDFHYIGSVAVEAAERLLRGGRGELVTVPYTVTCITRPDRR